MSGSGDPRRPVSSGSAAPPPRRSRGDAPDLRDDAVRASSATSAPPQRTVVAPEATPAPAPGGRRSRSAPAPAEAPATAPARRARAPWWLRIVAWVVAVPVGLALVGIPARQLGYLDSQKLLDVLIGEDTDRYLPLVVVVVLWALVTALLVQLIIEGGGRLLRRRRTRRAASAA